MTPTRGDNSALVAAALVILVIVLWVVREIVILICFSVLLAYLLDPAVSLIERVKLPRGLRVPRAAAASIVMAVLLVVLGWILSLGIPRLAAELGRFVEGLPGIADRLIAELRTYAGLHGLTPYLEPTIDSMKANTTGMLQGLALAATRWIGGLFGKLDQILGLILLPLLAFYLLAERDEVEKSVFQFVPEPARPRLTVVIKAVDRALRSYVRGLALVCLIMGTTTGIALALLGFPLALLLGVVVGLAEVVPYLGVLIASTAIAVIGYSVSPALALLGVSVYLAINTTSGFLVSPRVMGRHLKMHPFVVTVSILFGAELLGPAGAMLAVPTAAVIQSLIKELAPRPAPRAESRAGSANPSKTPG